MREKLIELCERSLANDGTGREMRFAGGDVVPAVRKAIQEWIPVSERLPKGAKQGETSENVIAYTIDGEVTTGWLDALGSDKWWLVIGTDDTHTCWGLGYVTHWMPLPQPPKGE